jgi:hypothetical protein
LTARIATDTCTAKKHETRALQTTVRGYDSSESVQWHGAQVDKQEGTPACTVSRSGVLTADDCATFASVTAAGGTPASRAINDLRSSELASGGCSCPNILQRQPQRTQAIVGLDMDSNTSHSPEDPVSGVACCQPRARKLDTQRGSVLAADTSCSGAVRSKAAANLHQAHRCYAQYTDVRFLTRRHSSARP